MKRSLIFLILVAAIIHGECATVVKSGIEQLALNAKRESQMWTAIGTNGTQEFRAPAEVPGGIYSDLDAAGNVFRNPIFFDYNDMETRWVGRSDWSYNREFIVYPDLLNKASIVLICEGLDTIAKVYVNDILVGEGVNMFVRYIYNVKNALKEGANAIRVDFQSPVLYALNQYNAYNAEYGYPILRTNLNPAFRGEDKAQMIRKMQASFSWDWGPSYPSSGIWQDIYIEGRDGAVMRDVMIFTTVNTEKLDETDDTLWTLTARVYFDLSSTMDEGFLLFQRLDGMFSTRVSLTFANETQLSGVYRDVTLTIPNLTSGIVDSTNVILYKRQSVSSTQLSSLSETRYVGSQAKLWWPNGYGSATLYPYQVTYTSSEGHELSSKYVNVGFRTVELIQDPVYPLREDFGNFFYFKVNGMKIFSKGSNSIPLHVLNERVTDEMTDWLLTSAQKLHTNQIRVWGGGIYASDYFYDLADKLGIFIWEDFMFACSMYPTNPEFLATVEQEVHTQVKRLQHHPSLLIWAANNENEGALRNDWYGTEPLFETYKADYIKLYIDTVMRNTLILDPSRECLSSSPTNGKKTEEEGWVAALPGDIRYGDAHPYNYKEDNWDWTWMVSRRTRYASEFGYQSFPYIETLKKVSSNFDQWTWFSEWVDHRQHHPNGQTEIHDLIQSHLPMPINPNSTEAFPSMLYMTQIIQSMGQKTQSEFYRRNVDKFYESENGTGYTMGALYWQLNDIWEGCSWSTFEINGRWKMYAYFAQRAFAPVLASPYKDTNGDVVVEVISESLQQYKSSLRDYLTSKEHYRLSAQRLQTLGCVANTAPCFVYTTMPQLPDNFVFLNYPTDKRFILNPILYADTAFVSPDGKTITFTLNSKAVAPFVFLNLRNHTHGYFSDNGFIMVAAKKELTYYSQDVMTVQSFLSQLDITSLYDVTPFAIVIDDGKKDDNDNDDEDNKSNAVSMGMTVLILLLSVSIAL